MRRAQKRPASAKTMLMFFASKFVMFQVREDEISLHQLSSTILRSCAPEREYWLLLVDLVT